MSFPIYRLLFQSIQHAFIQFGSYLAGPLCLEIRCWPDRTDRNMGIGQTKQTKIWVLARPNRPKFGYWPDRTSQNMGIGQTEQTEIRVLARPNRLKLPLARRKARPKFFPDHCGRSHRTPQSATQVGLANTCLGSRASSWVTSFENVLSSFYLNLMRLNCTFAHLVNRELNLSRQPIYLLTPYTVKKQLALRRLEPSSSRAMASHATNAPNFKNLKFYLC